MFLLNMIYTEKKIFRIFLRIMTLSTWFIICALSILLVININKTDLSIYLLTSDGIVLTIGVTVLIGYLSSKTFKSKIKNNRISNLNYYKERLSKKFKQLEDKNVKESNIYSDLYEIAIDKEIYLSLTDIYKNLYISIIIALFTLILPMIIPPSVSINYKNDILFAPFFFSFYFMIRIIMGIFLLSIEEEVIK